jgi:hypothetical protein
MALEGRKSDLWLRSDLDRLSTDNDLAWDGVSTILMSGSLWKERRYLSVPLQLGLRSVTPRDFA